MSRFIFTILAATLMLFSFANAQFGSFFDQMFQGGGGHPGHHHRQEPQNVPSDSGWYRENYGNGMTFPVSLPPSLSHFMLSASFTLKLSKKDTQ